jgi:GNAT superfamily N-acetyltransferase
MTAVKVGTEADREGIIDALVKAFHDDPVMLHIMRTGHAKKLRALFSSESKRALTKGALYTTADGPARGAAIWMAPGEWKIGGLELLGQLPMLFRLGADAPRGLSLLSQVEKTHPAAPHWYLGVLGTAPEHQGKGIGSALVHPILQKCDEEGIPAYLESSKESNVPFYERHGFRVTSEINIKNGPTLWPMWRDPRPPEL